MLFHLFEYLDRTTDLPGAGLFSFLSFRAPIAIILSLVISIVFGGRIVRLLRRQQVGETVRDLGLEGQMSKQGTPTMGGIMILGAILIPVLLVAVHLLGLVSISQPVHVLLWRPFLLLFYWAW